MDQLETMRVFARVAELGSFTLAAQSLSMPKGRASVAVQELEAALGTRLLHRTTRRVSLTQDGRVCYARCMDMLAGQEELQSMFRSAPQSLRGRIRVGLASGMACRYVVPHLPALLRDHPELEIELSSTDRIVDVVREGFDCVVRVGEVTDEGLIARRLGSFELFSCVSPAYVEKFGIPKTVQDLRAHRLVHYAPSFGADPPVYEYVDGEEVHEVPMQASITVNSADAYQAACLAGLGIIQVPSIAVTDHLASGELVEVLPQHRAEAMPVSIVFANRKHLARRVQVFMEWLGELLKPHLAP